MKTYNVLLLGPRGSGKTVFMGSMYYKLSAETETGFFVETESSLQHKILKKTYVDLVTKKDWPSGTQLGINQVWKLNCFVKASGKNIPVFNVNYYDYGGGILTELFDDEGEFKSIVKNSDILLGLIDGEILFPESGYTDGVWASEFDEVVSLMSRERGNKPIHFIVSKWDLLQKRNIGIADVIQKLNGIDKFKNLARNVKEGGSFIRIIPVSAVGENFVDFDEKGFPRKENGDIVIKKDALLSPYNVEIPLALSLLDPMEYATMQRIQKAKELSRTRVSAPDPNLTWWEKAKRTIGEGLGEIVDSLEIDVDEIDDFVEYWKSSGQDKIDRAQRIKREKEGDLQRQKAAIESEADAIAYIIDTFRTIEARLELEYPGSKIQ